MNTKILDSLSSFFFSFIIESSVLFVNLLYPEVVKYLVSVSDIFTS